MKHSAAKNSFLLFLLAASIIAFVVLLKIQPVKVPSSTLPRSAQIRQDNNRNTYTSKDLKISFDYPKSWYVEEADRIILVANFKSSLHQNIKLNYNQIEITLDEFANCLSSLEEDLINPACGQGRIKNKIISKKINQVSGGEFLMYTLDSYDENQRIQYFFRKDKKLLQISKSPDPSQFEEEFEDIVNSIRFID